MNRKILLLVVGGIVLLGAASAFFFARQQSSSSLPVDQTSQTIPLTPSTTLKQYKDPSGFVLSYPDNLSFSKIDTTDSSVYADIELTSNEAPGSFRLTITDTTLTSPAAWLSENNVKTADAAVTDTMLDTMKASQIRDTNGIVLVAIDQGIAFHAHVQFDTQEDFWMSVYDTFLSSFAFSAGTTTTSSSTSSSSGGGSGSVIDEGEEVIE